MLSDGAENNYHIASGAPNKGPETLSYADLTHNGSESTKIAATADQPNNDDHMRQEAYKADSVEPRADAAKFDIASLSTPSVFEKYDLSQPNSLMSVFGNLELVDLKEAQVAQATDARADVVKAKASAPDMSDSDYEGTKETQAAFASVAKIAPQSEIPDRLLATLDRLHRHNSQTPSSSMSA